MRHDGAARLTVEQFASAFHESFRLYWLIAVGITRDAALADDIVQDAAVIAMRKLDEFQPGTSFNAWMGQTVRFVAYNAARRERHNRVASFDPSDLDRRPASHASEEAPPLEDLRRGIVAADPRNFDDQVMHALGSISDTARACLLLRTLAGLEYAEISQLLGIPAGTAMSHVHRSRMSLRRQLAPHLPGWAGAVGGDA